MWKASDAGVGFSAPEFGQTFEYSGDVEVKFVVKVVQGVKLMILDKAILETGEAPMT